MNDLNRLYAATPALYELDFNWEGFQWIDCDDAARSVVSFVRRGKAPADFVVVVANFTPVPRADYRLGVPVAGDYVELLNSDAAEYGGGGVRHPGPRITVPVAGSGLPHSLVITLPPLALLIFACAAPAVDTAALTPDLGSA